MTAVGKILVFINLIFSLVVAAFIVMVFVARTNWHEVAKRQEERAMAANAQAEAKTAEAQATRATADKEIVDLKGEIKKLQADLTAKDESLKGVKGQFETEKENSTKADATGTLGLLAVQRHQEEVKRLQDQIKGMSEKVTLAVTEQNKLRDRAVAAEIENKTFRERNLQLAGQVEEMSRDNLRRAGGAGSTVGAPKVNPPSESIEGIVVATDAVSGMLTLSIGSDAGLLRGHTLEVFRLSPTATYLGTVKIVNVNPHEAVASLMVVPGMKAIGKIQKGDRVASKILAN